VNIHDKLPVRGRMVRDSAGRPLGRIVAVDYAATGTSKAWYLLRLSGWRGHFSAIPAASSGRGMRRSVQMALTRATVLRSPQLSRQGRRHAVNRSEMQCFYDHPYAPAGRA
jgi:hypothetical protein